MYVYRMWSGNMTIEYYRLIYVLMHDRFLKCIVYGIEVYMEDKKLIPAV